jgi:hypothetical protein
MNPLVDPGNRRSMFLMGLTQDRLSQEYRNGQLGNVEAVRLGKLNQRHKTFKCKRI